ncbi:TlpA family protein disulfide reductase [Streptomyces cyaneofuscatus]|uniref:TlpA family protein disulfide reductase n=1 Tax=Streptomyces cyaneofuscatus TaxID=66883 RepID=UPI0037B6E56E
MPVGEGRQGEFDAQPEQPGHTGHGQRVKDAALVYPSLHDPQGRQLLRLPKGVASTVGYPFTLIVDPEGRIAAARIGAIGEAELKKPVTPLLPA